MNLSILIHTFNGYQHFWPGCIDGWAPTIKAEACDFYFGTDIETDFDTGDFRKIYSGPGEWSDRLRRLLEQIPTDYILYAQEDHWPIGYGPIFSELMDIVHDNDLFRLQISPVTRFYTLEGTDPLYFSMGSKYLVSHQPSIWKKSFLLECLKPGESPWVNEYEGTKRVGRMDFEKKIAIYPCDWYKHMCIKGKMVES